MHEKHKEEIRTTVIDRYLSGISVNELSHQQGVPRSTIYHWIQNHNEQISSVKKTHDMEERKYKNHLKQDFVATQPQQKWVSDVTVFKYKDNWIYICVIIDLFSRVVIAHKIGYSNSTQLVKSTLIKAYDKRKPHAGLLFHTDRGSNYRSQAIHDYMQKKPFIPYCVDYSVV